MPKTSDYLNDLTNQKASLAKCLKNHGVNSSEQETFSTLVPKTVDYIDSNTGSGVTLSDLALLSDGGNVDEPGKDDYLNDLNAQRESLAETLQEAGVEASPEETFSTLVPKANANIPLPEGYIDSSKMVNFKNFFSMMNGNVPNDVSLLPYLDTSNGKYFGHMFYSNTEVAGLEAPQLDLRNAIDCAYMFYGSHFIKFPSLDLRNAPSCQSMFFNAQQFESCGFLDTRSCTIFENTFFQCHGVKTIDGLRTENGTNFRQMFIACVNLISIGGELDFGKATNVEGAFTNCNNLLEVRFKAIRVFDNNLNFSKCAKLSVESLSSILNALSDNSELDTTYTVSLGSANLAKLTEEQKAIAYNKNIDLA